MSDASGAPTIFEIVALSMNTRGLIGAIARCAHRHPFAWGTGGSVLSCRDCGALCGALREKGGTSWLLPELVREAQGLDKAWRSQGVDLAAHDGEAFAVGAGEPMPTAALICPCGVARIPLDGEATGADAIEALRAMGIPLYCKACQTPIERFTREIRP